MAVMTGLLFPGVALAETSGNSGFSFLTCMIQMFSALAVVVGAVYLLAYLARRSLDRFGGNHGFRSYIRVVENRCLAPKKSLILVEVAGEYLLLSNGGDGINLIKQIDMLEDAEVLETSGRELMPGGKFQAKLEGLMGKMPFPRYLSILSRSEG
jgi:flagellar protein FliO/FliZ